MEVSTREKKSSELVPCNFGSSFGLLSYVIHVLVPWPMVNLLLLVLDWVQTMQCPLRLHPLHLSRFFSKVFLPCKCRLHKWGTNFQNHVNRFPGGSISVSDKVNTKLGCGHDLAFKLRQFYSIPIYPYLVSSLKCSSKMSPNWAYYASALIEGIFLKFCHMSVLYCLWPILIPCGNGSSTSNIWTTKHLTVLLINCTALSPDCLNLWLQELQNLWLQIWDLIVDFGLIMWNRFAKLGGSFTLCSVTRSHALPLQM